MARDRKKKGKGRGGQQAQAAPQAAQAAQGGKTKGSGKGKDGKKEGKGKYTWAKSGNVEVGSYVAGADAGAGLRWNKERTTAWRLRDGNVEEEISLADAARIAGELGFEVP